MILIQLNLIQLELIQFKINYKIVKNVIKFQINYIECLGNWFLFFTIFLMKLMQLS